MIYLVAILFGLAWGYAWRGSLRRLVNIRLRAVGLIWVALALELAAYVPVVRAAAGHALLVGCYAVLGVWLLLNLARQQALLRGAISLIAVGWTLNFIVIAANGVAMPVAVSAIRDTGERSPAHSANVASGDFYKHVLASSASNLQALGDTIPIRPLHAVISPGDIVLWFGVAAAIALGMKLEPDRARSMSRTSVREKSPGGRDIGTVNLRPPHPPPPSH